MAPKPKKKPRVERIRCDEIEGERFHAQTDDVFRYNWWEVFCFPYILCARFWDCCISLCAGTNQCLVYWMMIQWIVCKITRLTTPNAIIFPYYFYMFCQVILLTIFFGLLWYWFGRTVVIPYFVSFYEAMADEDLTEKMKNQSKVHFRRYCFRKGEIFDNTLEPNSGSVSLYSINAVTMILHIFIFEVILIPKM